MSIQAIVYTSNTGHTAQYARLLGDKTGLPVYSLQDAKQALAPQTTILYLGWLMAGMIKDYKQTAQTYRVAAVCSVGLDATPKQAEATRQSNAIPAPVPLFPLPGGYAPDKLRGIYKFIMKMVTKALIKQIREKADQTAADKAMLNTLQTGGSYVNETHLADVLEWVKDNA